MTKPPGDDGKDGPRLARGPVVLTTDGWHDYELLDSGQGRKLERYGAYRVVRPEPQCLWPPRLPADHWTRADAVFDPADEEDAGRWRFAGGSVVEEFPITWGEVSLKARFTPFRHLAFFPEQAANWAWITERVRTAGRPLHVLNLFGYTGAATLACAAAGAQVTQVDASKKAVGWAKENAAASGLSDRPIRWIVEDARRYVAREGRRGSLYDAIILDPPKYGRGPNGEVWRLFEDLPGLIERCAALLSPEADFLLLNAYAARISGLSLAHALRGAMRGRGGVIDWGELSLAEVEQGGRALGLSFFARWRREAA